MAADKKPDATLPIIIVLAALLLLILFGGNCSGIPHFAIDTGSGNSSPGPTGNGGPWQGRGFGDRGRGCPQPGPDGCRGHYDGSGRWVPDHGSHSRTYNGHRGHGHRAPDRAQRQHSDRRDDDGGDRGR